MMQRMMDLIERFAPLQAQVAPEAPRVVANNPPAVVPLRQATPPIAMEERPAPPLPPHARVEHETPPMFEEEPDPFDYEPPRVPRYAPRSLRN